MLIKTETEPKNPKTKVCGVRRSGETWLLLWFMSTGVSLAAESTYNDTVCAAMKKKSTTAG